MKTFAVNGNSLALALYTDVTNSNIDLASYIFVDHIWMEFEECYIQRVAVLLQRKPLNTMQAGTLEPEVAFLNASLIPGIFPILAAAHKTLLAKSRESLTTRTLHSELVYNYSGSKHITESLKRCGISDNCTYVLVARFGAIPDMIAVKKLIDGKERLGGVGSKSK